LSEWNEIWQIDRGGLVIHHHPGSKIGELWPKRSPWGTTIMKGVKIVMLFSFTVWSSAMKFLHDDGH